MKTHTSSPSSTLHACIASFLSLMLFPAMLVAGKATLVSDTLSAKGVRAAGDSLGGVEVEKGKGNWKVFGDLVFREDSGVTPAAAGGACLAAAEIPDYAMADPITVAADLLPGRTGQVSVAFLSSGDLGKYWESAALWVFINKGGVGVFSDGATNTLFTGHSQLFDYVPGKSYRVAMTYDPARQVVSLEIDGRSIVKDVPVQTAPKRISHVAFRFNEPIEAAIPSVANLEVIRE